jgi:hypothetical protein
MKHCMYPHIYMDSEKIALEDLYDNCQLVVLENPPYQNAIHGWAKDGNDGINNWTFGELVSSAQSRASISRVHVAV